METLSPLTMEYGKLNEAKNGWNAFIVVGADTPSPEFSFEHTAEATHSVIVCGNSCGICKSPASLK